MLEDIVKGEIPEWFREELLSSLTSSSSSSVEGDMSLPKRIKAVPTDSMEQPVKGVSGIVKYKILTCETLYNLVQGNPHCCQWQQLLRTASKEEIETVAKVHIRIL